MQAKAFNPQVFLEALCCSFFGGLLLHLVSSGKYLSYVTPRMEPYLYFTVIIMLVWAGFGLFRLFRPQHKIRSAHCFVLVIPVLFLLLPHSPLSTGNLSANYVGGNAFSGLSGQGAANRQASSGSSGLDASGNTSAEDSSAAIPLEGSISDSIDNAVPDTQTGVQEEYGANLTGLDTENKRITVADEDFGLWLAEIYWNAEAYKGFTVIMTGFVYKDPETFGEDEFVTARLMMSCCAADLAPAGLLCKYDKVSGLKADSWVTVEGTLYIGKYEYDGVEYDDPQIAVTKITPAEEVTGYVYPY